MMCGSFQQRRSSARKIMAQGALAAGAEPSRDPGTPTSLNWVPASGCARVMSVSGHAPPGERGGGVGNADRYATMGRSWRPTYSPSPARLLPAERSTHRAKPSLPRVQPPRQSTTRCPYHPCSDQSQDNRHQLPTESALRGQRRRSYQTSNCSSTPRAVKRRAGGSGISKQWCRRAACPPTPFR